MIPADAKRRALLAAARALNDLAARAYEAATAEERRRREERRAEAERIVADGEAKLAEFVTAFIMLEYLEEEAVLAGQDLPRRLRWEQHLWRRLRWEGANAVENADPAAALRAVEAALVPAKAVGRGSQ